MRFIRSDSTVLSIDFGQNGAPTRVRSFLHAASHLTCKCNSVDLLDSPAIHTYFPLIYNPKLNPYTGDKIDVQFPPTETSNTSITAGLLGHISTHTQLHSVELSIRDIKEYMDRTGSPVDYVLLWGDYDKYIHDEPMPTLLSQLNDLYSLVYRCEGFAAVQLFKLK
jgi:hypothetical protein